MLIFKHQKLNNHGGYSSSYAGKQVQDLLKIVETRVKPTNSIGAQSNASSVWTVAKSSSKSVQHCMNVLATITAYYTTGATETVTFMATAICTSLTECKLVVKVLTHECTDKQEFIKLSIDTGNKAAPDSNYSLLFYMSPGHTPMHELVLSVSNCNDCVTGELANAAGTTIAECYF